MKNIILFASGRGSNVKAIYHYFKGNNQVKIAAIVCNNSKAGIIDFAKEENIPLILIDKVQIQSNEFIQELQSFQPELIVLAGFLWKIPETLIEAFSHKIINLHPALLPKYGGKGMYGENVHKAVIAAGEKETGITIHFIDEQYDKGHNIVQAYCSLEPTDDLAIIQSKIQKLEHYFLPRTIEFLLK